MIAILTSGVALGVHVPGLLLADRLRERGMRARVDVLERLLPPEKLATTDRMKWAFHRAFRTALTGQKLASNPADAASQASVEALFARWRAQDVRRFVVFSGFWLDVLARYSRTSSQPLAVDVCHVDSVLSPSTSHRVEGIPVRHVWLADAQTGRLPCTIPVTHEPVVAWSARSRLLLHGGGWGIGTYRDQVATLRDAGFELDVVAYESRDVSADDPGIRHWMIDPAWHPWLDDGYPPFGRLAPDGSVSYRRGTGRHASFEVTRHAVATVSKPGGGTLLDSLWSATPAIFLDPFGGHEQRNAELWQHLGFGLTLDAWRQSGYALEPLHRMHLALRAARDAVDDYSEHVAGLAGQAADAHSRSS
ncbi:hypothetical protein AB0M36_07685 [Actinoplanes sp. NPDC051346]|uniref:hypothetical protein n=1 Tax=Actinoplanes sp. NPDC051346 TaxID=3155048 RepID=UPI003424E98E